MIAIDLRVKDGKLHDVRIGGDFIDHPVEFSQDSFSKIAIALEGVWANTTKPALAARIRAALPVDFELRGTSSEAIAEAIHRAVGEEVETPPRIGSFTGEEIDRLTESWKSANWRLIRDEARSPQMNVALDEVLLERAIAGSFPPTLRFWRWTEPAVIIGRSQSAANEIDWEAMQAEGIHLVRRLTGGGAMLLQPHGAITYSLYLPESLLAGLSIRQSYEVCDAWLIEGLRELGVEAHHVPINDIACSDGKIGGAAQCRRGGYVLHHTTLAYEMDPALMLRVLRIGREKLEGKKGVTSASKRVSPLRNQTHFERSAIEEALFLIFEKRFGGRIVGVNSDELVLAEEKIRSKYGNSAWTFEVV